MRGDRTFVWALADRNKRAVCLDFESPPTASTVVQRLTAVADVVVLNQPARVLERWGCTYDEIAARNPGAIVVLVTGFGADGPNADRAGNGTVLEAYGGLTHMTGDADGAPLLSSVPIGDYMGAFFGVSGVLAALYWRDARGGTGQLVDVSIYEAVLQFLGPAMVAWSPGEPAPARTGSRIPVATPRNVYRTRDARWVVISGPTDAQVLRILELMGADTDETRAKFGRAADRNAHNDELDGMVAAWVASTDRARGRGRARCRAHPGDRGQRRREPARRRARSGAGEHRGGRRPRARYVAHARTRTAPQPDAAAHRNAPDPRWAPTPKTCSATGSTGGRVAEPRVPRPPEGDWLGTPFVRFERHGSIAHCVVDRPEARNAMTGAMYFAVRYACDVLNRDDALAGMIVTGTDPVFIPGGDLGGSPVDDWGTGHLGMDNVPFDALRNSRKPVISAVNGICQGGGLLIAIMSDIAVASDRATFRAPELYRGVADTGYATYLPAQIGPGARQAHAVHRASPRRTTGASTGVSWPRWCRTST